MPPELTLQVRPWDSLRQRQERLIRVKLEQKIGAEQAGLMRGGIVG
jgi:hypothetical protein